MVHTKISFAQIHTQKRNSVHSSNSNVRPHEVKAIDGQREKANTLWMYAHFPRSYAMGFKTIDVLFDVLLMYKYRSAHIKHVIIVIVNSV